LAIVADFFKHPGNLNIGLLGVVEDARQRRFARFLLLLSRFAMRQSFTATLKQ
jgi:hypothetical protein